MLVAGLHAEVSKRISCVACKTVLLLLLLLLTLCGSASSQVAI